MRELEVNEVDLVFGGYQEGQDGPSNYSVFGLAASTAAGGGAGHAVGSILGTYVPGMSGDVIARGLMRSTGIGAAIGGGWYAGQWIGAKINDYHKNDVGMTLGEALFRTFG